MASRTRSFGLAIVKLIEVSHDAYFAFRPDVFKAFGFRNNLAMDLVSVSADGKALPKLYHYSEFHSIASPRCDDLLALVSELALARIESPRESQDTDRDQMI